jgi:hypothetical protein
MVVAYLPLLRAQQAKLMTETVRIVRGGVVLHNNVPARITQQRMFTEPGDPNDANLRSTQEYGVTIPYTYTGVRVSDIVERIDGSLSIIVGEALTTDTWITAVRLWGTSPKTATPHVSVTLWRYQPNIDDYVAFGPYDVQVVLGRNQPAEVPARFSPAAQSASQGGTLIGGMGFAPEVDDRFTLEGRSCVIDYVLPIQPQRVEARFVMDVTGTR